MPNRARPLAAVRRLVARPILDLLVPTACLGCGEPLGTWQRAGVCGLCWSELRLMTGPSCTACAIPLAVPSDIVGPAGGRCARCLVHPSPLSASRAAVLYDRRARRLLLAAKLGRRVELFRVFAEVLFRTLEVTGFAAGCTAVVPVPSHPWVRLRRGFDPASELGRPIARRLDLPFDAKVLRRALRSPRAVKTMSSMSRRAAVRGAFRVGRVRDRGPILLVDDVLTTGATAAACIEVLGNAGVRDVRLAVWARTPRLEAGF